MATVEVGGRPVSGSDGAPAPEEAAGEELCKSPDRKHVDALLDISEEELLKELEPQEDICYRGWDEAVSNHLCYTHTRASMMVTTVTH